jgi:hypothetical protein
MEDINDIWTYLYDRFIEYENANLENKKSLAYYYLVNRWPSVSPHNWLNDKKLFLTELYAMMIPTMNGCKDVIGIILKYSNFCSDKTHIYGENPIRISCSILKNYELLLRYPLPTPCNQRRCRYCPKNIDNSRCNDCINAKNCRWKFNIESNKCSCGSRVYMYSSNNILDYDWLNRSSDQILGRMRIVINE